MDEPEKVDLETPDLAEQKRAAFEEMFPGVLADGVLDATRLGELLDTDVTASADGRERYGLMWAGKQEAVRSLLSPSRGALAPDLENSVDFDTAENVFIEGDNLEVLKLLQKAYNDKVKLIYIDPPYNTGNDFVYNDDFSDGLKAYLEYTGQVDEDGQRTSSSTDAAGRRHSKWLTMMYPRLVLARNLLTQDGSIFVSIDDNEVQNMRSIMDEVFGSENFVATIAWQKRYSRENRGSIGDAHEYILVYARSKVLFENSSGRVRPTEKQLEVYKNPNNDPRGRWRPVPMTAQGYRPNQMYEVVTPSGARHRPPDGRCWGMTEPEYQKLRDQGRIYFGKNGDSQPNVIRYLDEVEGFVPWTWWPADEVGHTDEAAKEVRRIFGSQTAFDTAKPVRLLRRVLEIAVPRGGVVLDFFAGTGTVAEAVLRQNAEDGHQRRYIAVQLPERTGHSDFPLVSDVTRRRVSWAMGEVAGAAAAGLRVLSLEQSNFREAVEIEDELDLGESTLAWEEAVWEAIAAEVLLKESVALDRPWERHDLENGQIVVSDRVAVVLTLELDDEVVKQALDLEPRVVVFLEDGFAGKDPVKGNAVSSAKALGITMKTV